MALTKVFQSQSIDGAQFTLKVVSRAARHRMNLKMAKQMHELRLLRDRADVITLDAEGNVRTIANLTSEERGEIIDLSGKTQLLVDELKMAYASVLFADCTLPEQLEVKTAEQVFEDAPEEFAQEMMDRAYELWSMPAEERKNSERPTSLQVPEDGPTAASVAESAKSSKTIAPELAA